MKNASKNWGFDPKNIDTKVRPQDDFYTHVNGGWLKRNTIPADETNWGTFTILHNKTQKQLRAILQGLMREKNPKRGSAAQLVGDLYRSATDMKRRNALGMKPIESWLKELRAVSSKKELMRYVAKSHTVGGSEFWSFLLDLDAKNSNRYLLHLCQGGIGLPDREYYLSDAPEQKRVRDAYIVHIQNLTNLFGIRGSALLEMPERVMRIETALAKASMKREDARDAEKTYHKRTVAQLAQSAGAIDWKEYFKDIGAPVRELIVAQPDFFRDMSRLIETSTLEELKTYCEWHLLAGAASLLSQPFIRVNFAFYGTVLTGSKKMRPLWRRGLTAVNGNLGEALGKLYVGKYFSPESKRLANELVDDLFAAYAERLKKLDWMSPATKKKALAKLKAMGRKLGYPSKWETYAGLRIEANDYFGNIVRSHGWAHRKEMRKLAKPVDRTEWFMTPQMVNAYCHFNLNEIVFPAAILQAPFFDAKADAAVNYAGIGAVIGHEITHGFDDQGSKFDARGNMKGWWTPADRSRFEKKSKILVSQFDACEILPGIKVNGKLTLGENIADLGGSAIAFDAYQRHLAKVGRETIDGFTPEERFFLGYAQSWREIEREEYTKMAVAVDPHSPNPLRVNMPLSNSEPFYAAFKLKKGNKLYRDPKARAKIW